jgi:lipopolysaccharide assembly outer membrane protein LptD (OstA)
MSGTIGQIRYFNTSNVALPSAPTFTDESSDYIAELRFLLLRNVNFDLGHQWGTSGDRGTTQSQARLQYRPATNRIVNLAYRFRRDSLEQGDVSWSKLLLGTAPRFPALHFHARRNSRHDLWSATGTQGHGQRRHGR